ncbi:hypothetical protein Glove_134g104 [Diversispora epigaea]|uniref:RNA polymerase II degradation factor 1 n=1 Tax=Diversispora epigaea TaxID=1348612 RepID=A0A397J5R3_9GLOM|nr:hypothetical protein Glove_134g104 [Diversispora epigaea]
MGSYECDTQRTNPTGKSNHVATDVAETEVVKNLKTQYKNELSKLQELFEDWTEADLLFALQEASGDLEVAVTRISEGRTTQWGEVKSRKSKKEHTSKAKESGQQSGSSQRGHQRGGYSDRGRPRGEGGFRGGSRTRGRRENGSGYTRPPRQQHNGPNPSNSDDTTNGAQSKLGTENSSNNDSVGGNSNESWSDSKGPAWSIDNNTTSDWSAENPTQSSWTNDDNNKVSWDNSMSTDKGPNNWVNDVSTDNSQKVRNGDENSTENVKENRATDNAIDNLGVTDKSTDNTKHVREPNIVKENINTWDTGTSKDSWGVENNWTSDTPPENWGNDNWSSDASKNGKNAKDTQRSPNPNASRSITATKSSVPHKSRTIPSQPKASWAQIVKPELKPEPKPEPVSSPVHKGSPEIVKSVSPQISKSPSIPVQTSPTPKASEPISMPSPETVSNAIAVKIEEAKESIKEISSPEESSPTPVVSSPVVNASPRTKEISPPGLHKSKAGAPSRRLKQDAPVVMPSAGAGLERVGVQFGSLSISNPGEEVTEIETPVSPQTQKAEERSSVAGESPQILSSQTTPIQQQQQLQQITSQQTLQQQAPQQIQQSSQQQSQHQLQQQLQQQSQTTQQSSTITSLPQTTNSINRSISNTSTQSTQNSSSLQSSSSVNSAPSATPLTAATAPTPQNFNPTYFKQQQEQTSATYINQQPHIGLTAEPLNAPYGSYLPSQPPSQLSGFGIGPIQSLPEYGALYGPEAAQRMMGYYATDPSYGQASPVTTTGYQNRDNTKYAPDTTNNSSSQTSNQQTTGAQQQSTNQQGQNPQQQQAYPLGVPYYPYYYMNQFPSAYQQSGYGQPFKSMYPMYNHPHSSKPGSASGASPYGYPTTPTTPNTPHHYSHTSTTGYDEITAAQIHHLPGVPSVHEYPKNYGGGIPPLNFLGNTSGNTPQPTSGASGSTTTGGGKSSNNSNSELNSPAQYKGYNEKTSTTTQQSGQSGTQHQHQQPTNPNYYGQQAQQMFNSYQYPQAHHQYHPHQAHHQASGRNQQQYWSSQS